MVDYITDFNLWLARSMHGDLKMNRVDTVAIEKRAHNLQFTLKNSVFMRVLLWKFASCYTYQFVNQ